MGVAVRTPRSPLISLKTLFVAESFSHTASFMTTGTIVSLVSDPHLSHYRYQFSWMTYWHSWLSQLSRLGPCWWRGAWWLRCRDLQRQRWRFKAMRSRCRAQRREMDWCARVVSGRGYHWRRWVLEYSQWSLFREMGRLIWVSTDGWAEFYSPPESISIWTKVDARGRDEFQKWSRHDSNRT